LKTEVAELKQRLKKIRSRPSTGETGRERVDLLNKLGMASYRSDPLMTDVYASEAMALSAEIGYRKGEARSNAVFGIGIASRGKYFESMKYFNTAHAIYTELDDKKGLADTYTNVGIIYSDQGRLDLALEHHLKALAIDEAINDNVSLSHSLNCIGVVFRKRNDLEKAEYYYMKALKLREITGDISGLAISYNNIGILAKERGNLEEALQHFNRSLKLKEDLGDKRGILVSYTNIGDIHTKLEEYTESLGYYKKSLAIGEEISDEKNCCENCNKIGHILTLLGEYENALEYLKRGLQISLDIGMGILEANSYRKLSDLYRSTGDYEKAFKHYKKHSILTREIFGEKSAETINRLQIRYETEKKEKEAELYYLRNVELQREINERKQVENQLTAHEHLLEERVRNRTAELQKSLGKLKKSVAGTIRTLSKIIESKDPYTSGHQMRVAELSRLIAIEMGLTEEKIEAIFMISLVHDIGKICIPQEILSRSWKLSPLEQEIVQTHPQTGYDILSEVEFPWPVAEVILQHHETHNGTGYPNGLKREEIMIEARIIAVADVVEAMTSHRPYRSIPGLEKAIEEISVNSGKLYDPNVVDACKNVIRKKGLPFQ